MRGGANNENTSWKNLAKMSERLKTKTAKTITAKCGAKCAGVGRISAYVKVNANGNKSAGGVGQLGHAVTGEYRWGRGKMNTIELHGWGNARRCTARNGNRNRR